MTNAHAPFLVEPQRFGTYRLVRKLPAGGMGRVYYAVDEEHNGRPVALKLIEHGSDEDSIEIVAAERRGAALQQLLFAADRRVTEIFGTGDLSGFFYIAMEYVEGQDLAEVMAEGPMEPGRAGEIAAEILEILHSAHSFSAEIEGRDYQGIVHGDIKPRNIRITPEGEVKILDFGIAKALSLTRRFTQNQFGSVQYSSPERLESGEVDASSDLWSVAVVLYEMLAGKACFDADSAGRLEHMLRNYRRLTPLPETFPPPLRAVLAKALDPSRDHRYLSAEAFRADLKAWEAGLPTNAEMHADEFEATRRTARRPEDDFHQAATEAIRPEAADQPTVRTAPAPGPKPVPVPPRPVARPVSQQVRLAFTVLAAASALWSTYFVFHEYSVWKAGSELSRDLLTEKLRDIDAAWKRYEEISAKNYLPGLLWSPRRALRDRLIIEADRVIGEFRDNDQNSITLHDWETARASLAHALELMPDDRTIKGKLRLCEGHLLRILARGKLFAKKMAEARQKFEESRDLLKNSPDPWLALANVYVYGMRDVERGEEALREAERDGHPMGRREKAELADGYSMRGDQLMREAGRSKSTHEEQDYLNRADSDFERSANLYQGIVPFAASSDSLRKVWDKRQAIQQRRDQIARGDHS